VTVGIAVFVPVMVSTLAGVVNIERIYMDVGKNFGANPFQIFSTIALPGALPFIFAGLKLGMGVAWLVLVSVEYTQSDGLGYFIWNSWKLFAVEELFVGLVTIAFMGFVSIALVDFVEKLVIRWKK
jgi:NitT/TauT family transport system permease protein